MMMSYVVLSTGLLNSKTCELSTSMINHFVQMPTERINENLRNVAVLCAEFPSQHTQK